MRKTRGETTVEIIPRIKIFLFRLNNPISKHMSRELTQ